jgi:pyruvate/2-oxoglutarate dehydrogenase complex dihydrolipoamide dehydrogenase (E3) component
MNTQHYDLISIGGGSGGLAVAEKAAMLGAKVAIIDPRAWGAPASTTGASQRS